MFLAAAVAMLGLAASGPAAARRPPPVIYDMVLGEPAPPPFGYYDFCQREAADCFTPEQIEAARTQGARGKGPAGKVPTASLAALSDSEIAILAAAASDAPLKPNYWSFAFRSAEAQQRVAYRGRAALAGPPAAIRPQSSRFSLKALTSRKRMVELTTFPPDIDAYGRIVMTRDVAARLNRINLDVNRRVISVSDQKHYGQLDVWNLPLSRTPDGRGDCEDYAVEKRHQLLAAGYPMRLLSLALVRTRWGDTHAVLLVETDQGAVALDSFSSWIVPWWKLDYQWIMRQSLRDPGIWVSVLGEGWSGGAAPTPG